jgi:hypothetical protein
LLRLKKLIKGSREAVIVGSPSPPPQRRCDILGSTAKKIRNLIVIDLRKEVAKKKLRMITVQKQSVSVRP